MPAPKHPKQVERREEHRQRIRAAIMASAKQQIQEGGYYGLKIEHVAQAVGLSVGAIYLYFKSKWELFAACIDDGYDLGHEDSTRLKRIFFENNAPSRT